MNERKQLSLIDWSGIALFALGALGTVLMFLAMNADVPLEQKGPFGSYAAAWKGWFGIFPSLFLNAAFLFLGARLFLKGGTTTLFRNLAGCSLLAVALSIFFGALSVGSGGWIGAHTGEVVTSRGHLALGALVGLVAMFAAAWFAWLRQSAIGRPTAVRTVGTSDVSAASKTPSRPAARPIATRAPAAPASAAEQGVTAAESAALFPLEDVSEPVVVTPIASNRVVAPQPQAAAAAPIAPPPIPRSPYPEDVRRKGQIPPGAKPLEKTGAPDAPAQPGNRWMAPRREQDEAARETIEEPERILRGPRPLRRVEDDDRQGADAGAVGALEASSLAASDLDSGTIDKGTIPTGATSASADVQSAELEAAEIEAARIEVAAAEIEVVAPPVVPAPSWEQPALFRPEAGDEEPVDAYGTPLTLVEKLRQARRIGGLEGDDADVVDDLAGDGYDDAPDEPVVAVTQAELGELLDGDIEDGDDEDDLEGEDIDDEDGDDEESDTAEIELQPVRAAKVPREIDQAGDDDDFDDLHVAVLGDDADMVVITADDEEDVAEEDEATDEEVEAEEEAVPEPIRAKPARVRKPKREVETSAKTRQASAESESELEPLSLPSVLPAARIEPVQTGLFDAPARASAAPPQKPAAEPARGRVETDKDVILQPVAGAASDRSVKAPAGGAADPKRLSEIGCLFIERGRVAVSMLQRQYEMDFDTACKVLDDLQEMGLIGPYLGGQRRDILLTREQWLERVSQAGAAR